MIPKIIHFCWLSDDPYPPKIQHCIDSWHEYLPDYEFIHWDKQKLMSLDSDWAREAFENKKYAFAADYIRCYSVFHMGGIYLDTDVEIFKSFDCFLGFSAFMGVDSKGDLEAAIFGSEKSAEWLRKSLEFYNNRHFVNQDGSFNIVTMPNVFKEALSSILPADLSKIVSIRYLPNLTLYPKEYFSPKDYTTGEIKQSEKTVCIHHFAASWIPHNTWGWRRHQFKVFATKFLGPRVVSYCSKLNQLLGNR